jgi:hypothetical protein
LLLHRAGPRKVVLFNFAKRELAGDIDPAHDSIRLAETSGRAVSLGQPRRRLRLSGFIRIIVGRQRFCGDHRL